ASAVKDGIAKGRRRLQRQSGRAKLVWCLGARTLCHRAGQARVGEGAHLDGPISVGLGGKDWLLPRQRRRGLAEDGGWRRGSRRGRRRPRERSLSGQRRYGRRPAQGGARTARVAVAVHVTGVGT